MEDKAVVALDIGGTNIRIALVGEQGRIYTRIQVPCRIQEGRAVFLSSLKTECVQAVKSAHRHELEIIALGAGVPGLIDRTGTVLSSVNLRPLDGFNLQQWLEELSGFPAAVMNDANAATLAEKSSGAGRPFSSLLHITLGTGVGSGLILADNLWAGADGLASEFGHVTVEPDGILCQCGNRGCLEQYASATAIADFIRVRINGGAESALSRNCTKSPETADIAAAARNGDPLALECFSRAGRYLGIACAAAVNMLNLEAIILGGGVSGSFDLLEEAIRREMAARSFHQSAARVKLLKGELGGDAGIMGAAAAAFASLSSV